RVHGVLVVCMLAGGSEGDGFHGHGVTEGDGDLGAGADHRLTRGDHLPVDDVPGHALARLNVEDALPGLDLSLVVGAGDVCQCDGVSAAWQPAGDRLDDQLVDALVDLDLGVRRKGDVNVLQ